MCYRALEHTTPVARGEDTLPTHVPQLRPRWVGAAVAAVAASAFAAFVMLPAVPDAAAEQGATAPQHAATTAVQPVAIDKASTTSLPADDGVPTTTEVPVAAGHGCHHGL